MLNPGTYAVTMTVTDDDGGVGRDTLTVTIANVPPTVEAGNDVSVRRDELVAFQGSFTDPGTQGIHTTLWDFGDGAAANDTLTPTHVYSASGTYAVTLTVTDDDGGDGSDTLTVTVEGYASVCTLAEMKTLLRSLYEDDQITHRGIYLGLRVVVTAAQRAIARDQEDVARVLLGVFNQLVTRYERHGRITTDGAAVLRDSARCVAGDLQ